MRTLRVIVSNCVQLVLRNDKLLISPLKLLFLLFSWVIPYLILANYLESCLLPFRALCYTQSDLLSTKPISQDFNTYILQFNFEDSYHNLSWKMMAIYGFVLEQLPSVEQIVVTNDDTIVNVTALEQVLHFHEGPVMLGKVSRGYPRIFLPWLTWHVPSDMYPHLCYPLFVQGSSFVLSKEGAKLLVKNVCKVPLIHLDDVFMGVLANCAGLKLKHSDGFDKHIFENFVVYHYQYSRHSADYLQSLWNTSQLKYLV
ncbi:unnamed protein product [Caenorhabditis bovis]|uniref:Hexosyltransferase n=1 Tax=Caenorhabditis bovis TaxID=2654633 RepID=A0A8S1EKN5_9PELO|nr:unnamed protein product [Caenorhabditis bovis]